MSLYKTKPKKRTSHGKTMPVIAAHSNIAHFDPSYSIVDLFLC